MEAGEDQGLVPVAGEGVGAGTGDRVQPVDVGADGLAAAAPFPGLEQLHGQALERLAGLALLVTADVDPALAQTDDRGRQVGTGRTGA